MPLSPEEAVRLKTELKTVLAKIPQGDKKGVYEAVVGFLNGKVKHYNWVGIYAVEGEDLVLEAWRGPAPTQHTRIPIGEGICGLAARTGATVNVPDVSKEPRYLQCFLSTKSELVVPILQGAKVTGEVDIDADAVNAFGESDEEFVESAAVMIAAALKALKPASK